MNVGLLFNSMVGTKERVTGRPWASCNQLVQKCIDSFGFQFILASCHNTGQFNLNPLGLISK